MYNFLPGRPCTAQDYHDPGVSREIAKMLGRWHGSLPVFALASANDTPPKTVSSGGEKQAAVEPNLWTNAQHWIDLLPDNNAELKQRNHQFRDELAWLIERFGTLPGLEGHDLVFSHTDLLCANVVLGPPADDEQRSSTATFIDYEYATAAPAAFDISNVFAEWAGPDGELSWMPSRSQRRDFIEHYVPSFHANRHAEAKRSATAFEVDVAQLFQQVEDIRGLSGFYWGIWGLIQASISDIDFDYVAYAARRLSEYWGWKAVEAGEEELSVREEAWARP
jgi:ethanolamine kinase